MTAWECTNGDGGPVDETVLALELAVSIATRLERRIASALVYLASLERTDANLILAALLRGEEVAS